jgi:hypothetical protein
MKWIHYIVLVNLESNSELNVSGSLIESRHIKLSNIKKGFMNQHRNWKSLSSVTSVSFGQEKIFTNTSFSNPSKCYKLSSN